MSGKALLKSHIEDYFIALKQEGFQVLSWKNHELLSYFAFLKFFKC